MKIIQHALVLDEKYLAEHYIGHNVIGPIHIGQKYFGQTGIGQNDFGRNVVFPLGAPYACSLCMLPFTKGFGDGGDSA